MLILADVRWCACRCPPGTPGLVCPALILPLARLLPPSALPALPTVYWALLVTGAVAHFETETEAWLEIFLPALPALLMVFFVLVMAGVRVGATETGTRAWPAPRPLLPRRSLAALQLTGWPTVTAP